MPSIEHFVIATRIGDERVASLRARFPEITFTVCDDPDSATAALAEADAFFGWRLEADQVLDAPRLRWVQAITAGVDGFLFPELVERGILLTNTSGVHASNMAEHLLALMLGFARGLPALRDAQSRGEWRQRSDLQFELTSQTVCIAGLGDIGLALASRAAALGMRVTGVRRRAEPVHGVEQVATPAGMRALLETADHLVLCLPLTSETRNLFDAERLAWLKAGAYVYNVGRGETLDHAALVAALRDGRLAGAGLDVTVPEPLPADHPLWAMPNVVITSHTSGVSPLLMDRVLALLVDNISRYQEGRPLRNVVDPKLGY